jgi:hypothetical protein
MVFIDVDVETFGDTGPDSAQRLQGNHARHDRSQLDPTPLWRRQASEAAVLRQKSPQASGTVRNYGQPRERLLALMSCLERRTQHLLQCLRQ